MSLLSEARRRDLILEHQKEQDYDIIRGPGMYQKMLQARESGKIVVFSEEGGDDLADHNDNPVRGEVSDLPVSPAGTTQDDVGPDVLPGHGLGRDAGKQD